MTDEAGADAGGETIAVTAPENTSETLSVSEAARALAAARHKPKEPAPVAAAEEAPAVEPTELADEANAAPEKVTGEDTTDADPPLESIEPPRSWSKEARENWNKLDPETQQYLLKRDSDDSAAVRKAQNEAAEIRKAAEAERVQAEKARKEYEAKLPALVQTLQDVQAEQFPDIRTFADVQRMALEDPFRKIQWDTHQQKLQAVAWEAQQAEGRKATEAQNEWAELVRTENAKITELVPEFADKAKAEALTTKALNKLKDIGFTDSELTDLATGKNRLPIYDHRIQLLILDALKYADIQKAKASVVTKPVPPVQRPGTARPPGAAAAEQAKTSINRLEQTGSFKDGLAALAARRAAQRRAS